MTHSERQPRPARRSPSVAVVAALSVTAVAAVPMALAVDITQTGVFDSSYVEANYDDTQTFEPDHSFASSTLITGLKRFDASLGYLRKVRIDATLSFQYDYGFDAQGILDTATGAYYHGSFLIHRIGGDISLAPAEKPGWRYPVISYGDWQQRLSRDGHVGVDDGEVSDGRNYSDVLDMNGTFDFQWYERENFIRTATSGDDLLNLYAGVHVPTSAEFGLINLSGAIGAAHSHLDAGTVTLTYTYNITGDIDGDDTVGFTDLLTLARSYGKPAGQTWLNGDLTGDGAVNFSDLLLLAKRYGTSADGSLVAATDFETDWALAQSMVVPEPAAAAVLAGTAAAASRRRRRRPL